MNRPRLFRDLRIAWSVGCGILCLLLIALWVSTYGVRRTATFPLGTTQKTVVGRSSNGTYTLMVYEEGSQKQMTRMRPPRNGISLFQASPNPGKTTGGVYYVDGRWLYSAGVNIRATAS